MGIRLLNFGVLVQVHHLYMIPRVRGRIEPRHKISRLEHVLHVERTEFLILPRPPLWCCGVLTFFSEECSTPARKRIDMRLRSPTLPMPATLLWRSVEVRVIKE